jgi:hypothetical protein
MFAMVFSDSIVSSLKLSLGPIRFADKPGWKVLYADLL